MITLTINGREIVAREGQSIIEVAQHANIEIPALCHHPDLTPDGSCRLCVVDIEGWPHQVAACMTRAHEGMVVTTENTHLFNSRKTTLKLLLEHYTLDAKAPTTPENDNEFLRWVRKLDAWPPAETYTAKRHAADSDPHPLIRVDLNRCILCTRCIRACTEIQGRSVWGLADRGEHARIVAGANATMLDARCESCGACVAYCPSGALSDRDANLASTDARVQTTCPYCGVGCGFDLHVRSNTIVGVSARPSAPVNGMRLCVKGRYGHDFVHHAERLKQPKVRQYLLDGVTRAPGNDRGPWTTVDWDTAISLVAQKLTTIKRTTGADAIGTLSSAKCSNEENYLVQKFARQVVETHNVDHCARLCHSSTVTGLAMALGSGAMSNTIDDISRYAQAALVIGSNTTEQHPVFGSMLRQAVRTRGLKLVVADPRAIDLVEFACLHVAQRPGSDVALLNGLMHIILKRGWHNRAFIQERTEGFDDLAVALQTYTPEAVSAITGVNEDDLHQAAEVLARNSPMAVIWAMGITQHTTGVMNVLSLANLQLLLGNLGVAGGGVNPLRGQNNVQGACDMGALPNVFPGYQAVSDEGVRAKFQHAWSTSRCGEDSGPHFSSAPGLTVTELINAAGEQALRAMYIVGENPVMTDPNSNHVRSCLEAAEFVVLQEIFPSQSSQWADVLLPASSWAEKAGTFTNTERRVQLFRKAVEPPGQARADWAITAALAREMLTQEGRTPEGDHAGWDYTSAADILSEVAALAPSYAGVSHARLNTGAQLHWPVPGFDHPGTPILHVSQFPLGKGRFHACEHQPPRESTDAHYPLCLTTGRVLYHWHGGEMTRRVSGLLSLYPEPWLEMNSQDAAALGIETGHRVRVHSRRGTMLSRAFASESVLRGVVFGNFHFPGEQNVNNLTIDAVDPVAKIPEYKVCAVRVERIEETD